MSTNGRKFSNWRRRVVVLAALGSSFLAPQAEAWPWRVEPQPLLHGRDAMVADQDSPLAWDQSGLRLWHLAGGKLAMAYWSNGTFNFRGTDFAPDAMAGLLVDPALGFIFYVDAERFPTVIRRLKKPWQPERIGTEKISRLLAVDARRHAIFAYEPAARAIRRYAYEPKSRLWTSEIIAAGLGRAEEAGAFDPLSRVLYTSHETADATVPRHPSASTATDPTGVGLWKPWPLVATSWTDTGWTSRVLDETGVPQQPAVRMTDRRLFYAQRDEPQIVRFFQPAWGKRTEAFGSETGWAGADTWEDKPYPIRKPDYPSFWTGGSVETNANFPFPSGVALPGPITIVPFYQPIWTDTAFPPRLARFRAVVNGTQSRLVQHRLWVNGETLRTQTGQQLAGYLYRGANGVFALRGQSSSYEWIPATSYPQLPASFNPANPPADFANLASPTVSFFALKMATTLPVDTSTDRLDGTRDIPTDATVNAQSPWAAPYVRPPASVKSSNFGHNYISRALNQTGGRFQRYDRAATGLAASSQLAVDAPTGASFYTQAPAPTKPSVTIFGATYDVVAPADFGANPLSAFGRSSEGKYVSPRHPVWIVFVY